MEAVRVKCEELLRNNGPVAVILKEYLRPAEGDGEPIFPPTYPMPTYRGRVHTVRDGEYRVSVELPPYHQGREKNGKDESVSAAGYNIDEFKDGTNICEIDSPQSQANRIEPLFKTIKNGKLVPQIKIKVGQGQELHLLDAGHRAADAVVRFSSLVSDFHDAFQEVRRGTIENSRRSPHPQFSSASGTPEELKKNCPGSSRRKSVQRTSRSLRARPNSIRHSILWLQGRSMTPLIGAKVRRIRSALKVSSTSPHLAPPEELWCGERSNGLSA